MAHTQKYRSETIGLRLQINSVLLKVEISEFCFFKYLLELVIELTNMDSNKDEATRCIEIAVTALTEGKISRAEKFLKKAEQLYPSVRAKGMLRIKLY